MPHRPPTRCPTCKTLHHGIGKCDRCKAAVQKASDQQRGSAAARGYGRNWTKIRGHYLKRNPQCCLCQAAAEVPDHYPVSRRDLIERGDLHPDADQHLRPLCRPCHSKQTAIHEPGGWNRR